MARPFRFCFWPRTIFKLFERSAAHAPHCHSTPRPCFRHSRHSFTMGKSGVKVSIPDARKAAKKTAKLAAAKKLEDAVTAAEALDPEIALAPFIAKPFVRNGLGTSVQCVADARKISAEDKGWIWNLLETNMRPVYGPTAWRKEAKEKKSEMTAADARYLIARATDVPNESSGNGNDPDTPCLGFVHYKFVVEEGVCVLYVYELQIAQNARRRGVGKFLMMLAEVLAKQAGCAGVMLTVQCVNAAAISFYEKNKYVLSPISPRKCDPWAFEENQYDYDIYQKIWTDDAAALLLKEGDAAFAENEEMFCTASVFVHSNDELKEAFKKAQIA